MHPDRSEWTGFYYDGRTAERHPVTVTIGATGLHLRRADGSEVHWLFDGLRQTQGAFSREQLRLEYGPPDTSEALVVEEDGLAEAVERIAPGTMGRARARRSTAKVVAWSLAGVSLAVAAYAWGAPLLTDWVVPHVPIAWEVSLGRSAVERLAPARRRCADSTAAADLRVVVDRLLASAPPSPYEFHLFVARDTEVNAFAAPGGFIVLNGGLLAATRTPEELAGVVAHEIQHIVHRHSTRAVVREVPMRLALATLSGSGGAETAAAAVGTLGVLRYQRADEAEADRDGFRMLEAARIDPSGMVAFMRTLEVQRGSRPRAVSYLSSHPPTAKRVAALESMATRSRREWRPVLDSTAWARVRGMCAVNTGAAEP